MGWSFAKQDIYYPITWLVESFKSVHVKIILFFPGKMPPTNDIAQWINAMFKVYIFSGVYLSAIGFYEVLLSEPKYKIQWLEESPLAYRDQMVHGSCIVLVFDKRLSRANSSQMSCLGGSAWLSTSLESLLTYNCSRNEESNMRPKNNKYF